MWREIILQGAVNASDLKFYFPQDSFNAKGSKTLFFVAYKDGLASSITLASDVVLSRAEGVEKSNITVNGDGLFTLGADPSKVVNGKVDVQGKTILDLAGNWLSGAEQIVLDVDSESDFAKLINVDSVASGNVYFNVSSDALLVMNLSDFITAESGDLDWTKFNFASNANMDVDFANAQITFNAVPEPSAYAAIFGALALSFAFYRRRK